MRRCDRPVHRWSPTSSYLPRQCQTQPQSAMSPAPWTTSPEPLVLQDDYTVATRGHPVSHPPVDAPLCVTCRHLDLSFFDPSCPGCAEILGSRSANIRLGEGGGRT